MDWIHNANEGGPLDNETLIQKILDKFLHSVLLPKITLLAFIMKSSKNFDLMTVGQQVLGNNVDFLKTSLLCESNSGQPEGPDPWPLHASNVTALLKSHLV